MMDSNMTQLVMNLIPQRLDDIIRTHRDQARLYLSTDEEVMDLHADIAPGYPKEIIDDWRFITLYVVPMDEVQVMLLGDKRSNGYARITSVVRKIDLDRGYVVTNSGSLYHLGTKGYGEPPFTHLAMVCHAFHSWGFG